MRLLTLLSLLLLTACFTNAFTTFTSATTPDEKYRIEVNVGEAFGFGSHPVQVSIIEIEPYNTTHYHSFDLNNDGANLRPGNLELIVLSNTNATLCARGQQQKDTLYTYQLDGGVETIESIGC